jgi:hypothetical protein
LTSTGNERPRFGNGDPCLKDDVADVLCAVALGLFTSPENKTMNLDSASHSQ